MLLGVDRGGTVELGRGDRRGGVGGGRVALVSGGGRDATIDARAVVEAALGAVPVSSGARGDRAVACAGAWGAGGRPAAGAIGLDGLARAPAQCRDAQRWSGRASSGAMPRRAAVVWSTARR